MSFFVVGILKSLILEAIALLGVVDASLRRTPAVRRSRVAAYAVLGGLVWLAFLNFGSIHGQGQLPHWAEQYHFDLGDKYLRELRYDGLYLATAEVLAERGVPRPVADVRDPTTFELVPPAHIAPMGERVRRRFSPARWRQFGDDLAALLSEQPSCASTGDHGNTASPSGAIVPWLLLQVVPMRGFGFRLLALADVAMLGAVFLACWRWASLRVAAAAFALALLAPDATDYLLGSLFRFDWLAASLAATLALWRGKRATAGALYAYAALSRPFALAFGLCAAVGLAGDLASKRVDARGLLRFATGAVGGAAALVVVSSLMFGPSIWPAYGVRMMATLHEGYYGLSHGFRNVYAQIASDGPRALLTPVPDAIAAARAGALEALHGLGIAQGIFALLVLAACFRDGAVMGAGLGVLLSFATVVTNGYYQSVWGVLALACALHAPTSVRARLGLALACAAFAGRYVMQHFGSLSYAHHYFASWTTFAFAVLWLAAAFLSRAMPPAPGPARQA